VIQLASECAGVDLVLDGLVEALKIGNGLARLHIKTKVCHRELSANGLDVRNNGMH
jgi:hypothetical protein